MVGDFNGHLRGMTMVADFNGHLREMGRVVGGWGHEGDPSPSKIMKCQIH